MEVLAVLAKLGLSNADILILTVFSAAMLAAIFVFLFLGMQLFSEGSLSSAQSVINSLITAGSAVAFNANASSGEDTKLMVLLNKAMDYVKKMQGVGEIMTDILLCL